MFTKAEIVCGVSGFLIIMGMLLITPSTASMIGTAILSLGVVGIVISTNLHESD